MTIRPALTAVVVGVLATTGCSKQSAAGDGPTAGAAASVRAQPTGTVDMASAVRQWWQRAASISRSRYFDPGLCGLKQPDKIWLLGGGAPQGKPQRSCAVPAHRPILAPVANYLAPAAGASHLIPPLSPAQTNVTLDGKPLIPIRVTNNRPYRIVSAAPDNPMKLRDRMRVIDDGYWVLINPGLAPGRHQLDIHTSGTPTRLWTLTAS
jgi:hypothetical protein